MASMLASQFVGSLRCSSTVSIGFRRAIHLTPVARKKKAKVDFDDLFDDTAEQELFTVQGSKGKDAGIPPTASTSTLPITSSKRARRLTSEARVARFTQVKDFISPRLGRKPVIKAPQARNSAWAQLVQLATTEEQLKGVTDMMPCWIAAGRTFDASFSELFVRRCEELRCPQLAVEVYGTYAKYGLPLTLPAARQLLHSLHLHHPLSSTLTVAALYPIYHLPPVSQDLVSCALVTSACFHHAHVHGSENGSTTSITPKNAMKMANTLVPQLEKLVKNPLNVETKKHHSWVMWSLKKVDMAFKAIGEKRAWLEEWRIRNGEGKTSNAA